ncbi:hypothetical protein V8D89_012803 [Ganoderma adspersum]
MRSEAGSGMLALRRREHVRGGHKTGRILHTTRLAAGAGGLGARTNTWETRPDGFARPGRGPKIDSKRRFHWISPRKHHPVPRPVRVPPRISRVSFEGAQRRSDEPRTTVGEHRNGTARVSRRGSSSPRDSLHLPASNEAGFAAIGPLLKIGPTKRFHCTSIPAGHCACSVRRPLPRTPQRTIFVESVGPVERERRVCGCRVRVFKIDFGSGPGGAPWARLGQRLDRRAARPTTHVDRLGELIRVWATRLEPQDGGNRKFGAGGCGVGLPAHGKAL